MWGTLHRGAAAAQRSGCLLRERAHHVVCLVRFLGPFVSEDIFSDLANTGLFTKTLENRLSHDFGGLPWWYDGHRHFAALTKCLKTNIVSTTTCRRRSLRFRIRRYCRRRACVYTDWLLSNRAITEVPALCSPHQYRFRRPMWSILCVATTACTPEGL